MSVPATARCIRKRSTPGVFAVGEGRTLRIADDEARTSWWATPLEEALAAKREALAAEREALAAKREALAAEREALAAKREALAAVEAERAGKEAALARVAELERALAERRGG